MFVRDKSALSKDFWRATNSTPSLSLTGYQNVAVLMRGQLDAASAAYAVAYNLTKIWREASHPVFHNYRYV